MKLHLFAAGIVLAAVVTAIYLLKTTMKKSLYRFRCILLCAGILGGTVLAAALIYSGLAGRALPDEAGRLIALLAAFPENFSRFAMWAIAALGFLMFISNIALMRHEGMRPTNMVGTFLGVIFIAGTGAVYLISRFIYRWALESGSSQLAWLARYLTVWFYCLLDYCECITLGIGAMGYIAARGKPSYDKDFIIILGCSVSRTGGLLPLLKGRTNRAIKYAWEQEIATGKNVRFVPSGGQGSDEVISEGSAIELYLLSHAAESYEVFPEKKSTSTYENFLFSKQIIDSMNKDARVAFATTNYHVLRSGMLARRVGLDAEGIASSTKWYFWPNGFAREVVAIFKMTVKYHIAAALDLAALCLILLLL